MTQELKHLAPVKYCTLKEGDATLKLNIKGTRSDCAISPLSGSQRREDGLALGVKCRSGFGDLKEYQRIFYFSASLPLEVAELNVFLAAFLLSEQWAEGVEFGFGWVALASNVHLILPTVDEVRGDGCGEPLWAWWRRYKAKADVALQGVAIGAAGGCPGQLAVTVDGLPPPRPQV